MAKSLPWHVVTERRPCPVCSKLDSCMYAGTADSPHALCIRTHQGTEGDGGRRMAPRFSR